MSLEELKNSLDSMTKKDIVDFILNLVEEQRIDIDVFTIETQTKMTDFEKRIIDTLKEPMCVLTQEQRDYVNEILDKNENRKTRAVLKGQNQFVKELVVKKIDIYFTSCWTIYPRKIGKQLATKAFLKLFEDAKVGAIDNVAKYVLEKVKEYAQQCEDNNTEEQYIMHFSTFCNSKKYL